MKPFAQPDPSVPARIVLLLASACSQLASEDWHSVGVHGSEIAMVLQRALAVALDRVLVPDFAMWCSDRLRPQMQRGLLWVLSEPVTGASCTEECSVGHRVLIGLARLVIIGNLKGAFVVGHSSFLGTLPSFAWILELAPRAISVATLNELQSLFSMLGCIIDSDPSVAAAFVYRQILNAVVERMFGHNSMGRQHSGLMLCDVERQHILTCTSFAAKVSSCAG
eukprot:CAMPEP_0204188160 /NCGR_PEP_ID=MMETSP0361-20130328/57414_1 /ASSEMBLY_ACC=CAM_ASM_000343 /TAXON_ID=268821 /ORGANISM="Scrippsiella Hangoei, Strain SHTV-5" /LENGTH=222 /DNA_ID=CAMNT_0051148673 /DNA_START=84 /DNA_END=749 /DNA_ORIENTATION=+